MSPMPVYILLIYLNLCVCIIYTSMYYELLYKLIGYNGILKSECLDSSLASSRRLLDRRDDLLSAFLAIFNNYKSP